jgi:hypothetical protein
MTGFDHREEAFEAKFARDEESAFKARARALRMLGLWAAGKRGETGKAAAEAYAQALIEGDIGMPNAAFNKLVRDLAGHMALTHGVKSRMRFSRSCKAPSARRPPL